VGREAENVVDDVEVIRGSEARNGIPTGLSSEAGGAAADEAASAFVVTIDDIVEGRASGILGGSVHGVQQRVKEPKRGKLSLQESAVDQSEHANKGRDTITRARDLHAVNKGTVVVAEEGDIGVGTTGVGVLAGGVQALSIEGGEVVANVLVLVSGTGGNLGETTTRGEAVAELSGDGHLTSGLTGSTAGNVVVGGGDAHSGGVR